MVGSSLDVSPVNIECIQHLLQSKAHLLQQLYVFLRIAFAGTSALRVFLLTAVDKGMISPHSWTHSRGIFCGERLLQRGIIIAYRLEIYTALLLVVLLMLLVLLMLWVLVLLVVTVMGSVIRRVVCWVVMRVVLRIIIM